MLDYAIWIIPTLIALAAALGVVVFLAMLFRIVVPTNMVHIAQSRAHTRSYGVGQARNVYYRWPSWVPYFGITTIQLPISNFDLTLQAYEAYDEKRVPFTVDVVAFFRIANPARAAERVVNVTELEDQLRQIVQGAVRKVLASDNIDNIMLKRAEFGAAFTEEVDPQLPEWGVTSVKSLELMDIRDSRDSKVIHNIMAKQISHIEMDSRIEVAKNMKDAKTAEIAAKQEVDVRDQTAMLAVGQATAAQVKEVGIANQVAQQEILVQKAITTEKEMAVKQVENVRAAEITREQEIVVADQEAKTAVIVAQGNLEAQQKEAQAIEAIGLAKASAEKAMQTAPVEAKILLAKEIKENDAFQRYLAIIDAIAAHLAVGTANAEALKAANIKVFATGGNVQDGVLNASGLFSSKLGTDLAAAAEGLAMTPTGEAILDRLGVKPEPKTNGHTTPEA